jgi:hypothetical protein
MKLFGLIFLAHAYEMLFVKYCFFHSTGIACIPETNERDEL